MYIRVRNDDVLIGEASKSSPFRRFKQVHELICETSVLHHYPAIVVDDIKKFPECIRYVRDETKKGNMNPEVHGLYHLDYATLSYNVVYKHLITCKEFIQDNFNYIPVRWYTPWGADSSIMRKAAQKLNLELINCENRNKLRGRNSVYDSINNKRDLSYLNGKEIFVHWWDRLDRERLKLVVDFLRGRHKK